MGEEHDEYDEASVTAARAACAELEGGPWRCMVLVLIKRPAGDWCAHKMSSGLTKEEELRSVAVWVLRRQSERLS